MNEKMESLQDFINGKGPDREKLKDLLNETYFLKLEDDDLSINRYAFSDRRREMLANKINKTDLEIFRDHVFSRFLSGISHLTNIKFIYYDFCDYKDIDKILESINIEDLPDTNDFKRFFPKRGLKTKGCRL